METVGIPQCGAGQRTIIRVHPVQRSRKCYRCRQHQSFIRQLHHRPGWRSLGVSRGMFGTFVQTGVMVTDNRPTPPSRSCGDRPQADHGDARNHDRTVALRPPSAGSRRGWDERAPSFLGDSWWMQPSTNPAISWQSRRRCGWREHVPPAGGMKRPAPRRSDRARDASGAPMTRRPRLVCRSSNIARCTGEPTARGLPEGKRSCPTLHDP